MTLQSKAAQVQKEPLLEGSYLSLFSLLNSRVFLEAMKLGRGQNCLQEGQTVEHRGKKCREGNMVVESFKQGRHERLGHEDRGRSHRNQE